MWVLLLDVHIADAVATGILRGLIATKSITLTEAQIIAVTEPTMVPNDEKLANGDDWCHANEFYPYPNMSKEELAENIKTTFIKGVNKKDNGDNLGNVAESIVKYYGLMNVEIISDLYSISRGEFKNAVIDGVTGYFIGMNVEHYYHVFKQFYTWKKCYF